VRHAYGDATMWMCVACVGVIAGILGLAAARGHDAEAAIASAALKAWSVPAATPRASSS